MCVFVIMVALFGFWRSAVSDDVASVEIEYLLESVGHSGCVFIRNGSEHSSEDAESHLRLKYRNGKKWAKSAELFIKRLATKSSWTKKAYYLRCEGESRQPVAQWLKARLANYRGV
ncbi:MAG: hypothetical protein COA75_11790 [Cellvibrionales bacterium]|nr:MAG: hypothetical protein COA75_11790 [Cellvibrionales bacterium]